MPPEATTPEAPTSEAPTPEAPGPEGLTPHQAAQWARRAGLPLASDRLDAVTATANHIQAVVATLRELDFGDVPPAATYAVEPVEPLDLVGPLDLEVSDATV
ncbi:hypothetical protein [Streptomyces flavofungini]|uniref:hypothetical protein n=1 Tax=Streptomyces flavofungini TaxID=68200 RepID=UPI003F5424D6